MYRDPCCLHCQDSPFWRKQFKNKLCMKHV
jgi:hypothetical protein